MCMLLNHSWSWVERIVCLCVRKESSGFFSGHMVRIEQVSSNTGWNCRKHPLWHPKRGYDSFVYILYYHMRPVDGARKGKRSGKSHRGDGALGVAIEERWEVSEKVKLTFLRQGRRCKRGFVNELVCMSAASQWPRARSWHATDTRQKLTLTPQIITFSLWKLALLSHSSHSVSVLFFLPALFLFLTSPPLALVYWRKNGVDSEKQLPVIYLSISSLWWISSERWNNYLFSNKIKAVGGDSRCHNMWHAIQH